MNDAAAGDARLLGPEEGAGFWQPVPANGHVRTLFSDTTVRSDARFAMGTQTVAPGCFIREHTHDRNEEIIYVVSGRGHLRLDGEERAIEPGSAVFIGRDRRHGFVASGREPLTFVWYFMPGGLDAFFAAIGRPRTPGEPAPEPFPRPENVAEIERRTVFGWTDPDYRKEG
ncbi:MAG: cupin domain-containing protein [Geminicoccaceae bacterium]|nr:cupin domain-containing protein [Geminicoccaceae bacterium]